jgi:hypothetical protein
MSRQRSSDAEFGSDSFLDIVANVVGILIILIVVAGLRVSRAPVVLSTTAPPAPPAATTAEPPPVADQSTADRVDAPPPVESEVIHWPADPVEPPPLPPRPVAPPEPQTIIVERPLPPLPPIEPPRELLEQAERLRQAILQLDAEQKSLDRQSQGVAEEAAGLQTQLALVRSTARTAQRRAAEEQSELAAGERELEETLARLAKLKRQLEEESHRQPEPKVLQHRITPIGKVVHGQELHFLLSRGRVSPVPVEELARRLTAQIERQKEMLAKLQTYEGEVEAVDGFRMKYVVQRSRLSLAEELRYGQHVIRMGVTQWTLIPEPNLPSESAAEAIQRGSRFYQTLLSAGPNATLTLWVYPDSFETCQALKEFAHRHGYEVAARPLPFGVMITGSPEGSRSIAQ